MVGEVLDTDPIETCMAPAVLEALTIYKPASKLAGVMKTLSPATTPVAVQLVVVAAPSAKGPLSGSTVQVPVRMALIGEPSVPTVIPPEEVVVPVTPKAT